MPEASTLGGVYGLYLVVLLAPSRVAALIAAMSGGGGGSNFLGFGFGGGGRDGNSYEAGTVTRTMVGLYKSESSWNPVVYP